MKKKFLTIYDYGTGGVWQYIFSNSRQEILNKYPKLKVISDEDNTSWLSEDKKKELRVYDIDEIPDEFLSLMMENNKSGG